MKTNHQNFNFKYNSLLHVRELYVKKNVGTQAQICIGPWALFEEAQWSQNRSIARKTKYFELHRQTMTVMAGRGCPRRNIPSAKRNEDQDVPPVIHGDVPGGSIDKDMHYERTGRMRARKYLRKNCYHRIECSAANFLVTFMWRRPLNSAALATPIHRGSERVSDGISTQVVAWMINKWRAKTIQREIYNVRNPKGKGSRNQEKNTIAIRKQICNQTCEKYIRTDFLKLCRG